jgi:hypothetical protein
MAAKVLFRRVNNILKLEKKLCACRSFGAVFGIPEERLKQKPRCLQTNE